MRVTMLSFSLMMTVDTQLGFPIVGITASGPSEKEAIRELSRCARRYLQEMDEKGLPRPRRGGSMSWFQ